jgi:predicted RNA-binding Zn ribbon-like protein
MTGQSGIAAVAVGERIAPGALALVQAFVNTNDREGATDVLRDAARAREWFGRAGLPAPARLRPDDLAEVVALREAIRDLVRERDRDDGGHEAAAARLAGAVDALALTATVAGGRVVLRGQTALGRALAPVVDALRTGMDQPEQWRRLKVCDRDRCQWVFYDASRNCGSRWCRTDLCGSREKARRAYARRTGRSPAR